MSFVRSPTGVPSDAAKWVGNIAVFSMVGPLAPISNSAGGLVPMYRKQVKLTETLERRVLMDAVLESGGLLRVTGTAGADVIGVAVAGTSLRVDISGTLYRFDPASVTSIQIDLKEGNDQLAIGGGIGNVYCLGGLGEDVIVGGAGNDTLVSGGGKDRVFGGDGDDRLDGGPTADRVFGENGADRIYGGDANDTLEGGAGVGPPAGSARSTSPPTTRCRTSRSPSADAPSDFVSMSRCLNVLTY